MKEITIGILGLQGAIEEHEQAIIQASKRLNLDLEIKSVLLPEDLDGIDGIIMPGGESTAMIKQGTRSGLLPQLRKLLEQGLPAFGTCAGAILLSKRVKRNSNSPIQEGAFPILDMTILRNGYGRQKDSFTVPVHLNKINQEITAVFIRAPIIEDVSDTLQVLASLDKNPIMVQQGNIIASTFHPELSGSDAVHSYFLNLILLEKKS